MSAKRTAMVKDLLKSKNANYYVRQNTNQTLNMIKQA